MKLRVLGAAVALVLVSACGGGGGGNNTPVVNAKAGGVYTGSITPNGQPTQQVVAALVTESGEARLLTDIGTVFSAQLNTNGNNVAGNFTGFTDSGTFGNGRSKTAGMLAGTISERASLNANYSAEAGDRGALQLAFNGAVYNQPSSLATLAGTFGYTTNSGYSVSYSVQSNGVLNGSDNQGCTYAGNFSIADARFAVYRLSATSSCTPGTFTGLALYSARSGTAPDRILFILTSNDASFYDVVDRQ